jgi:hypothetical protein
VCLGTTCATRRRRLAAGPLFVHYEHASLLKSRFNEQVEFLEAFLIQLVEREGQPVVAVEA